MWRDSRGNREDRKKRVRVSEGDESKRVVLCYWPPKRIKNVYVIQRIPRNVNIPCNLLEYFAVVPLKRKPYLASICTYSGTGTAWAMIIEL